MKFLHLSDLHLGKRVNEFSMTEDQRYILNQILEVADREKVDGIWIAGDVYDKSVPSAEAVQLFDDFLTALVSRGLLCFIISGNHDSAERIAFGAHFMDHCGVYLSPVFDGTLTPIKLEDSYGPLHIYLLPFLKPAHVRQAYQGREDGVGEKVESYQDAVQLVLQRTELEDCRNVILAHQFLIGASRCESEELSVGGLDQISAELFEAFDYTALGHLHMAQTVGNENIRYCGSPLKYSFSEARGEKSVTVVELREKGTVSWHTETLRPRRDLREIKGTYLELTALENYKNTNTEDYLHVTLTEEEEVPDALGKLRSIYPNIMKLDYDNHRTRTSQVITAEEAAEQKSPLELLEELYRLQNNQEMSPEQKQFAQSLMEKIWE